jgi:HlyD family secretion protein
MNTSRLIAKSHIAQSQAVTLKVGDPATIQIAGLDDTIPAKVSLVSPALDPGSTTIEVWVETSKPPDALKPGMSVQIAITAETAKNAILVPRNSVFESPETGSYVLLAGKDGLAHQTPVQLGLRGPTDTQILKGLVVGDSIITSGAYALPDKTKIRIEAPASAASTPGQPGEKSPSGSEKE